MRLPPIDAHAHVAPAIAENELQALGAAIFAVTREPREWPAALERQDRHCVWGLGCHPAVPAAVEQFDPRKLESLLVDTPLVGEVGLDARSPIPGERQQAVFDAVLSLVADCPRIVSVHSAGRSTEVLDAVERNGSPPGIILHWWRGTPEQTARAVDLGCYFSVNGAEIARPRALGDIPRDRMLTETDYPHTRKADQEAVRPGAVATVEEALAAKWSTDIAGVRRRLWANLERLGDASGTLDLMPRAIQTTLLTVAA